MPRIRSAGARLGLQAVALLVGLTALVGVAPVGAVVDAGGPTASAVSGPVVTVVAPGWRKEMMARINEVRTAAGVRRLKPCPALRRSAQEYAMLIATRNHLGHVGPDGSQPGERMLRQGYRWRATAENIAAGQRSIDEVMAGWVSSPGHYANLVNPALRHVGLGHASSRASGYGDYWVLNFGRGRGC